MAITICPKCMKQRRERVEMSGERIEPDPPQDRFPGDSIITLVQPEGPVTFRLQFFVKWTCPSCGYEQSD